MEPMRFQAIRYSDERFSVECRRASHSYSCHSTYKLSLVMIRNPNPFFVPPPVPLPLHNYFNKGWRTAAILQAAITDLPIRRNRFTAAPLVCSGDPSARFAIAHDVLVDGKLRQYSHTSPEGGGDGDGAGAGAGAGADAGGGDAGGEGAAKMGVVGSDNGALFPMHRICPPISAPGSPSYKSAPS
jgi:uncharacterized membrane protein YgcG